MFDSAFFDEAYFDEEYYDEGNGEAVVEPPVSSSDAGDYLFEEGE
jgi:hypothetical protein